MLFHTFFKSKQTNKHVFFFMQYNFHIRSILQMNIFPSCCTESLLKDFEFSAPIEKQFWCLAIFLKLRSSQRDVLFEFSVRNQVYESAKIPRREINYIGDQKSAKSVTFVIPAISNLIHHYLKVEISRRRNPNVQNCERNP